VSYFSRWARVALSVRSLAPTNSRSAPEASAARKKLRPIRPNPLIPTRTVTGEAPRLCASDPPAGPMGPRPPDRRPVVGLVAPPNRTLHRTSTPPIPAAHTLPPSPPPQSSHGSRLSRTIHQIVPGLGRR